MARYILLCGLILNFFTLLSSQEENPSGIDNHLHARRLVCDAEHTAFLKEVLATATRTIMISTYNVSSKRLFGKEKLGKVIMDAAARGIAIYIYYENRPWYSSKDFADLESVASCCAKFDENANHSKCIIKDNSTVAIGSYNWLSDSREESSNGTIILTGEITSGIIAQVWQGIRFYQSLEHGNETGIEKFLASSDAFSTGCSQFIPGQFLYTARTPEAHELLLQEVFEKAETRIILFSPFIRQHKLHRTLTHSLFNKLGRRDVKMKLITLPNPCSRNLEEQRSIFSDLDTLCHRYPNFSYVTYPNFHAKTLIADHFICEGSFNWLSAVSQLDHDANNFEMSIALRGAEAHALIQSFEETEFARITSTAPEMPCVSKRKSETRIAPIMSEQQSDSRKKTKALFDEIPADFESLVKVFSGKSFGMEGYCVRFNDGDYLKGSKGNIVYFPTQAEAKYAAYDKWRKTQDI